MNNQSIQPKEWARLLYICHGKTIREVALTVEVDEAVVRQWILEGAWDNVRRSQLISRKTQLGYLYDLVEKLSLDMADKEQVNTKNVDLILKYTASIKNLEEPVNIGTIVEVAEQFTSWLVRKDRELSKQFALLLDEFIRRKAA